MGCSPRGPEESDTAKRLNHSHSSRDSRGNVWVCIPIWDDADEVHLFNRSPEPRGCRLSPWSFHPAGFTQRGLWPQCFGNPFPSSPFFPSFFLLKATHEDIWGKNIPEGEENEEKSPEVRADGWLDEQPGGQCGWYRAVQSGAVKPFWYLPPLTLLFLPRCPSHLWENAWQISQKAKASAQSNSCGYCCCCSVTQSCLTHCNPVDCSMPGIPVHHHLPELAQAHLHWVGDAIQPSHPLWSPSPSAFHLSQHQGHF